MKAIWHLLLVAVVAALCSSCGKNEFEIDIKLPQNMSNTFTLVYYASDKHKGWVTQSAITVSSGHGRETCVTRNPTVVWVDPDRRGSSVALAFYAERGDKIEIRGEELDPLSWEVVGNDINEEWSKWRIAHLKDLQTGVAARINSAVAEYVKGHTDSELSTLLLLTTYVRREDEEGFARLWNSVSADAKSAELLAAVGRADVQTALPVDAPVAIGELKLHCMGESIATVKPSRFDASLYYFWSGVNGENSRSADIDSIKHLLGEERGGKLLDVTDIALTADSMKWLNKARADSLGTLKWRRAWAPGGRMHSSIQSFAIPASPWFVVLDRSGRPVYRGAAAGDALKTVRETLRKAPARKQSAPADTTKQKRS